MCSTFLIYVQMQCAELPTFSSMDKTVRKVFVNMLVASKDKHSQTLH